MPGLELSLDNSAEPSKRANKRHTRRGCRAGRLKKRHIDVVITTRIPQTSTVKRKVCTQNVIQLGGERHTSNCFIEHALINHTRSVQLDVQCLNVRSVKNKALSVADMVISRDIDILALTETLLGSAIDDHVIHGLVPRGYEFHAVSRSGRKRGGGVAVLHKSGLKLKKVSPRGHFTHFEHFQTVHYISSSTIKAEWFGQHRIFRSVPDKVMFNYMIGGNAIFCHNFR